MRPNTPMTLLVLLLSIGIWNAPVLAQDAPSVLELLKAHGHHMDIYYTIGPWDNEMYHLENDLELSDEEVNELREWLWDSQSDSAYAYDIRDAHLGIALERFEQAFEHPDLRSIPLDSLGKFVPIQAISPDRKLICIAWDENHGGTYLSQISVVQYRPENGPIRNYYDEVFERDDLQRPAHSFNADGYFDIDTVRTEDGVVYVMDGSVKGCSTCFGLYVDFFAEQSDSLAWLDGVELSYRMQGASYDWDQNTHTLKLRYMYDDLNEGFVCDEGTITETEDEREESDQDTVHICEFKFNGQALELISTSTRPYDPEKDELH